MTTKKHVARLLARASPFLASTDDIQPETAAFLRRKPEPREPRSSFSGDKCRPAERRCLGVRFASESVPYALLRRGWPRGNMEIESRSMGRRVFVGSLSWNTDDNGLRAAFERFGTIEDAKVIEDRQTGRSRGFGFVTFSEDSAAQAAIQEMNGAQLDGRTVAVNEAQERAPRAGGFGGGDGGGGRGQRRSGGGSRRRGDRSERW